MAALDVYGNIPEAFTKAYGAPWTTALELVVARLRDQGIAGRIQKRSVVLGERADINVAQRLATERPYELDGAPLFVPLFLPETVGYQRLAHAMSDTVLLRWGGAAATSRLVIPNRVPSRRGDEFFVPGLGEIRKFGPHRVIVTPTQPSRIRGEPVKGSAEVLYAEALVMNGEITIVFGDPTQVFAFARGDTQPFTHTYIGGWALAAMDVAFQKQQRFSLTVIEGPVSLRARAQAIVTPVERTISHGFGKLVVVAVAEPDALLVHSDQLKEHFSGLALREAFAEAGEPPETLRGRLAIA